MADSDATRQARAEADALSFEEAFRRLGETVAALEVGGLSLADATARYEEGMRLVRHCNQLLSQTELKVTQLRDAYGTPPEPPTWEEER